MARDKVIDLSKAREQAGPHARVVLGDPAVLMSFTAHKVSRFYAAHPLPVAEAAWAEVETVAGRAFVLCDLVLAAGVREIPFEKDLLAIRLEDGAHAWRSPLLRPRHDDYSVDRHGRHWKAETVGNAKGPHLSSATMFQLIRGHTILFSQPLQPLREKAAGRNKRKR